MATTATTANNDVTGISKDAAAKIKAELNDFSNYVNMKLINFSATAAQLDAAIKGSNIRTSYNNMIKTFTNQISSAANMSSLINILDGVYNQYTANDKKSSYDYSFIGAAKNGTKK